MRIPIQRVHRNEVSSVETLRNLVLPLKLLQLSCRCWQKPGWLRPWWLTPSLPETPPETLQKSLNSYPNANFCLLCKTSNQCKCILHNQSFTYSLNAKFSLSEEVCKRKLVWALRSAGDLPFVCVRDQPGLRRLEHILLEICFHDPVLISASDQL